MGRRTKPRSHRRADDHREGKNAPQKGRQKKCRGSGFFLFLLFFILVVVFLKFGSGLDGVFIPFSPESEEAPVPVAAGASGEPQAHDRLTVRTDAFHFRGQDYKTIAALRTAFEAAQPLDAPILFARDGSNQFAVDAAKTAMDELGIEYCDSPDGT